MGDISRNQRQGLHMAMDRPVSAGGQQNTIYGDIYCMSTRFKVRYGGLMRCCIKSLDDYEGDEAVGTVLHCKYCMSGMVVAPDGVWEWGEQTPSTTSSGGAA